jgi:hypothetical protein
MPFRRGKKMKIKIIKKVLEEYPFSKPFLKEVTVDNSGYLQRKLYDVVAGGVLKLHSCVYLDADELREAEFDYMNVYHDVLEGFDEESRALLRANI